MEVIFQVRFCFVLYSCVPKAQITVFSKPNIRIAEKFGIGRVFITGGEPNYNSSSGFLISDG